MTRPRKELICSQDTPYYHVVSRCVRRTFLCGVDQHTGKNYEHRRQWIENRIRILASLFAIDICAYAVMSNHLHIVVKINDNESEAWTNIDVAKRWTSLFKGPLLLQQWQSGKSLIPTELQAVNDCINVYRQRLGSLSWFMKCLNEPIAREANKEDGCTGHFWESRFKSQALLTEKALLSCMAYVDLNPIRANMASTPEESDHTSIKERITPKFNLEQAIHQQIDQQCLRHFDLTLKPLAHFEGSTNTKKQTGILFSAKEYLQLVDCTSKLIHPNKHGAIPSHLRPILQRLHLNQQQWIENATQFEQRFNRHFAKRKQRLADTG